MAQTKLITGGTNQKRLAIINQILEKTLGITTLKLHPDLLMVEGFHSIGIDQIRELKKKLALKPYSSNLKVGLILEAEKLTLVAQNALLKTLEEPPANSLIILSAPKSDLLLTTIVSRCQIISLPQEGSIQMSQKQIVQHRKILTAAIKSGVGERLKIATNYTRTRQEAIEFNQGQLLAWRQMMLENPSPKITTNIRQAQKTLQMLEANTNPILTLGNLFLSFHL